MEGTAEFAKGFTGEYLYVKLVDDEAQQGIPVVLSLYCFKLQKEYLGFVIAFAAAKLVVENGFLSNLTDNFLNNYCQTIFKKKGNKNYLTRTKFEVQIT